MGMKILLEIFFEDSRIRGHELPLVKDQCRVYTRKHSFSQRTMNELEQIMEQILYKLAV